MKFDDELDGASPGLRQAILVSRHGRRGPVRDGDAPRTRRFPGTKAEPIPGQLTLGEDLDEQEEPAA
jgi:hypothetical protein